jgi:Leucine-rich repeat (LRR) protein
MNPVDSAGKKRLLWIRIALVGGVIVALGISFYLLERQRDDQLLSESIRLTESLDGEAVAVTFLNPTVTTRQLEYIRRFPKLRRLIFKETTSLEGGLESLLDLTELTTIDLSETGWLDEAAMSVIAAAPNLSSLTLSGSTISDSGLAPLMGHRSLQFLYLAGCSEISDQSIDTLTSLPSLELLVLANSGISPKGFRQLRDARRTLIIYYSPDPQQTGIALNGRRAMSNMIAWGLDQVTSSAATADLVLLLTSPHDWSTGRWTSDVSLGELSAIELSGPAAMESLAWLAPRVSHPTSIDLPAMAVGTLAESQLAGVHSAVLRNVSSPHDLQPLQSMKLLTRLSLEVADPLNAARLPNVTALPELWQLTLEGPGVNAAFTAYMLDLGTPPYLRLELARPSKSDALRDSRGWRELRHLTLKGPGVNGSVVDALSQIGGLQRLELELTSPLEIELIQPVNRLPELVDLKLRGPGVNEVTLGFLSRLATPTSLDLELRVPLSPPALQELASWRDLERITLTGAGVNDSLLRALAKITRLQSLHLEITSPMESGALQPLSQLPHLRYLVLEGPGVTDAMVASLTSLPVMEYLSVSDAPVSDAGVAPFLKQPGPPRILAEQTRVSPEMLRRLEQARNRR